MQNQYRVYLHPRDYETVLENAVNETAHLAIRLCGEASLRVGEAAKIRLRDVRTSTELDVPIRFLSVKGKDTSGKSKDGKLREVPIDPDLYQEFNVFALSRAHAGEIESVDDQLIGFSKRTVQKYIKQSAEAAAAATGNDDYAKISAHDFRAYFATTSLVRKGLNPRIVMEVGGWKDYKSIQPYLNAAFDDIIVQEFFGHEVAG